MLIKDFLYCDAYQSLISELRNLNFNIAAERDSAETILIGILKDQLKQRQFVLYGFSCTLQSEEESVEWLLSLLENSDENIKYICARDAYNKAHENEVIEEYPLGEEPDEDDKPAIIENKGYAVTSFVSFLIDLDMIKNHPRLLVDYYKRRRIPYASIFASDMKRVYKGVASSCL